MSEKTTRHVETVFSIADRATMPLQSLGRLAMSTGSQLASLATSPLGMIFGGAGAGAAVAGVMQLHGAFETTQNTIAGTLSALGMSSDFNAGLRDAAQVMDAISIAAAALPGEAEDYVTVFRQGLPMVQGALPGGSLEDIYNFTNRLTAIGRSLGVQADLIGRDITDMLRPGQGGASLGQTQIFEAMLPFMRQLEGQANLTAQSFNRMTAPQRAQLLQRTFGSLQPMLDHASESWDALSGAFTSNLRMIGRNATGPLFEGGKAFVSLINNSLMNAEGQLTPLGQGLVRIGTVFSKGFMAAFERATDYVVETLIPGIQSRWQAMGGVNGIMGSRPMRMAAQVGGVVAGATSRLAQDDSVQNLVVGMLARSVLGPFGLLVGPLMVFARDAQAVADTLHPLQSITIELLRMWEPLVMLFGAANNVVGALFAGVLPGLMSGLAMAFQPVAETFVRGFNILRATFEALQPAFHTLGAAIGNLFRGVGAILHVGYQVIGTIFVGVLSVASTVVVPVFNTLARVVSWVISSLGDLLQWIARWVGRANQGVAAGLGVNLVGQNVSRRDQDEGLGMLDRIRQAIQQGNQQQASEAAAQAQRTTARRTPAATGGHQTNFINNRFDITQKFAEGFDPDRLVAAFAQEIERSSDRRLQSGFDPLFALA